MDKEKRPPAESSDGERKPDLETQKLRLEESRYRTDLLKWLIVALGAVISFWVIDYGKLRLEQFRVTAENERLLLNAYLTATDAPQPDVWKRKLYLLMRFSSDGRIERWARSQLDFIESFGALDTLYFETLKVASQLVEPDSLTDTGRSRARVRFNQLYFADLPYAGESREVINAMVDFRKALIAAEEAPKDAGLWEALSLELIGLSRALREHKLQLAKALTGSKAGAAP